MKKILLLINLIGLSFYANAQDQMVERDLYIKKNTYYNGVSWQNIKSRFFSYGGHLTEAKWLVHNIPESEGRFIVVAGPEGSKGSEHIAFSIEGNKNAFFSGDVGIGTSNPRGFKLAVKGKIGAEEIQVKANYWSDLVFYNDYKLRDLEEVEAFIKENKHLPDIPSENDVMKNGINVGEMDAKLLQKIEEITIYMIELNKEVKSLRQENSYLKDKIQKLEKLQ